MHNNKSTITITIPVQLGDYLYKEYLDYSVDHPAIILSDNMNNQTAVQKYDPYFKETKSVFTKPLTITLDATITNNSSLDDAHLHLTYYLKSEKKLIKKLFSLTALKQLPITIPADELNQAVDLASTQQIAAQSTFLASSSSPPWSARITNLLDTTQSPLMRIILIFILGLLVSLTPCIYPMIPITAGILQAQSSSSILRNFFLSLCYTAGISTTFAFLGLLAAYTGHMFGSLLQHPAVIIGFVFLLLYLAGSLLGLYTLYIPAFLPSNKQTASGGSPLSAFLCGAASGTVASPCVSPGLIVVLSLVATCGSKLIAFITLFIFGIGLSTPLLIIGSFSSSLNILPQAGPWMTLIKYFFGFLLIGMSLYLLRPLLILSMFLWLGAFLIIIVGFFSFAIITAQDSASLRFVKNGIGSILIASSFLLIFKAYQATYFQSPTETIPWQSDYITALKLAQQTNKPLLVDIGAPICSLCNTIDKRIFCNTAVIKSCSNYCIPVKIDASDQNNRCCLQLKKKYNIVGAPTILLINPETQQIVKQWGSDLCHKEPQQFIAELQQHNNS